MLKKRFQVFICKALVKIPGHNLFVVVVVVGLSQAFQPGDEEVMDKDIVVCCSRYKSVFIRQ